MTHTNLASSPRSRWTRRQLLVAFGLVAVGLVVTLESWQEIVSIASKDSDSMYLFFVPFIAGGMFWVRRGRFRTCMPRKLWIGPVILGTGAAMLLLGERYWIQSFRHAGAVLMLSGCILSVYGMDVLWNFLPGFCALAFLVPIPGLLRYRVAVPLQTDLASVTSEILGLLGLSAFHSGNLLEVNGTTIALAEGGTGLREFFLLALFSFAFVFGKPLRNRTRLLMLILGPFCLVFCNVLRLVPLAWWASRNEASAESGILELSGWLALGGALLLLLGIFKLLRRTPIPVYRHGLAYDR